MGPASPLLCFLRAVLWLLAACGLWAAPKPGDVVRSSKAVFKIEEVAAGLGVPWGIAFLPDGDLLFTEREGRVRWVRKGELMADPVEGVPAVWARGQGGLLDIALHPRFETNRWVYLTFSAPNAEGKRAHTGLFRARFENGRLTDGRVLYRPPDRWFTTAAVHFGSRIVFDRSGALFLSLGDRGDMLTAQDLGSPNGKLLRLRDDGSVPGDNPFVGRAYALPEIWSYGHRNPQGLAFDRVTGELWEAEHGPKGGDELNLIRKGGNYGWPSVTHGVNYDGTPISDRTEREGMEPPHHVYVPSIAICGIAFSNDGVFPAWAGDLFVASLKFNYVERLEVRQGRVSGSERLLEGAGRTRHVAFAPDGTLHVLLEAPGRIWRLVPATAPGPSPR